MTCKYDIIGDIHGHADELISLLKKMGYAERDGVWRHSDRMAIFVGDFIDRGPKQVESVTIAKRMVEAGSALAVLGNHELSAIAWYTRDADNPDDYLRSHFSPKYGADNYRQHMAFLKEMDGRPELHREIIEWFLSLPLWLDLPDLRVVHACWHSRFMEYLSSLLLPGARLSRDLMPAVALEPKTDEEKDSPEPSPFKAAEMLTKGLEIPLPEGYSFKDKDGIERKRVRVRWWDDEATTYHQAAFLSEDLCEQLPKVPIPIASKVYKETDMPVFIGHYWLTGEPELLSAKVACVDYSAGKGGPLCAYRWDGEKILDAYHFCWVDPKR